MDIMEDLTRPNNKNNNSSICTCAINSGGNTGREENVSEYKIKTQLSDYIEGREDDHVINGKFEV